LLREVLDIIEILDSPKVNGEIVGKFFTEEGAENIVVKEIREGLNSTHVIRILIPGTQGKASNGEFPTLGIIGMAGGVGAYPEFTGLVSDADGVITALAAALKLTRMKKRGISLKGDVIVATHVTPRAKLIPHEPVPFVGSPISVPRLVRELVDPEMDAILSIDTTRGNRVINVKGIAITPTVKEGWILKVPEALLDILQNVTGRVPAVVPITMQDITPYGTGVYHINSIMQPATVTSAPVVGVALTAEVPVPGCATGATDVYSIEHAVRFCIEVAKEFTSRRIQFYDEEEYKLLVRLYGKMNVLQKGEQ